jgi:uncharacterized protein
MNSTVTPEQAAKEFMEFILTSLIEDKDQLELSVKTDDLGVLVSIKVSDNDMGKIIGKNGQTIQALRTLLRILGGSHSQRMNLKVIEP